jgi:biopolymer transport protein ExbD
MAIKLSATEDDLTEHSDINVTPFIDVMLVLLIIFMVAAPLATVDVPVDLPGATAKPQTRPSQPLFVSVKTDLTLALGDEIINRAELPARLDAASKGDKQQRIFLRADKHVSYGDLMTVMNQLRDAGYLKIALVGLDAATQTDAGSLSPAMAPSRSVPAP